MRTCKEFLTIQDVSKTSTIPKKEKEPRKVPFIPSPFYVPHPPSSSLPSPTPHPPRSQKTTQGNKKKWKEEYSQTQRNIPIPILIILLKHIRHPLQTNTSLHKQIKANRILASPIISAVKQGDELRTEAVAKGNQRFAEFFVRDVARTIDVEAVEELAPGGEEAP